MQTLTAIQALAEEIDTSWEELGRLDWSEAEQLVTQLRQLDAATLKKYPELAQIIAYADSYEDWDSGYVVTWPTLIMSMTKAA